MATTTNYGWDTPDDTDLVKDGAAAIRTLGSSADTTLKNLNPETTTGDIAYRSATANVNTRLALGTAGQVLRVNSGATAPEWATTADQTPLTTKGDLFGFDTADARIPVGTNGHILTADSTQSLGVKWAAAAAGGYTELATGSISGSDLTLTSISGSYIDLRLYVYNVQVSTASCLKLQMNGVTASTYAYNSLTAVDAGVYRTQTASSIFIFTYNADTTGTNNSAAMEFPNYAVANSLKTVHGVAGTYEDSNNAMDISHFVGTVNSSAAITELKVFPSSGTFTGTYKLYGVK